MARESAGKPDRRGAEQRTTVRSWEDLQRDVEAIVGRLNADDSLILAAAANPLFALEELGYEVDPAARPEIEDRLRFRPPDVKRLGKLRRDLHRQAGEPFDPASDADVRRVLTALGVKLGRRKDEQYAPPPLIARLEAARRPSQEPPPEPEDPFESLRDKHPIIEPLLDYRRLEATEPRLAAREVYASLRDGRRSVPIRKLRAVVKADRKG